MMQAKNEYLTRRILFPAIIVIFVLATAQNQVKIINNFTKCANDNPSSETLNESNNRLANALQHAEDVGAFIGHNDTRQSSNSNEFQKPRIAIISSFIQSEHYKGRKFEDFDHLINKVCYAKLWGYDFILNTTYGFDKKVDEEVGGAYWLNYGNWQRVPHISDRINDYDWILYTDVDYIINDMKTPLESFFKTWKLHGVNPSVLIPKDFDDGLYTFSDFVVMIKNDPFGRKVLDHWMEFGRGLCPNGNLAPKKRPYTWEDSDQPGIWYALTQTHKEFFPEYNITTNTPICDEITGLINTSRAYGPEMNQYFSAVQAVFGSDGSDLLKVPIEQPILWSLPNKESMSGLGMQLKWGVDPSSLDESSRHIFAFHHSDVDQWLEKSKVSLDLCKRVHGCYARYNSNDKLEVGCDDIVYTVA